MTTSERNRLSRTLRFVPLGLAVLLLLLPTASHALDREPGQVRVKFRAESAGALVADQFREGGRADTGIAGFDALGRELGVSEIRSRRHPVANAALDAQIGISRWYTLTIPGNADVDRVLQRLRAHPDVEAAVAVHRTENFGVPNDTFHYRNWGANNTAQFLDGLNCSPAPDHSCGTAVGTAGFDASLHIAWNGPQGYGDPNVVIGIIDSHGVDVDHPDLNLVAGYDFVDDDADPDAAAGQNHGTGCAGIAAAIADNGLGVAGVAGGCSIMPLKADNTANVSEALVYAADAGVEIVSMSFGFIGLTEQKDVEDALQYAYLAGVTMFAAAGNESYGEIYLPASHFGVITIGAASPCGSRKRGSSDPSGISCDNEEWDSNYNAIAPQDASDAIDLLAPTILPSLDLVGEGDAWDNGPDYDYTFNGTSCAAPFAAGIAALLKSRYPNWSPEQIRARMVSTATDVVDVEAGAGWDVYSGYGLVDAAAALLAGQLLVVGSLNYPTIQSAIDAASDFDRVRVPAGTYNEAIDFLGKQIVVESMQGPASTIIDATGLDDAVVSFRNDETRASVLRGFTITGGVGRPTSLSDRRGGGVHVVLASPTIESCIVDGNTADLGGGIYLQESGAAIRNCVIGTAGGGNVSTGGAGGIHVFYAHPSGDESLIEGCTIQGNVAGNNGGGILVQVAAARVIDCDFLDNVAGQRGGGIETNNDGIAHVHSSRFVGNESAANGGGFSLSGSGLANFWECDFEGNTSTGGDGGGISVGDSVSVFNSRIFANTAQDGGGVRVASGGILRILHSTVVGNTSTGTNTSRGGGGVYVATVASIENSIVWGNAVSNGDGTEFAQVKSNGATLDLVSTCIEGYATLAGTNLTGSDPGFVDLPNGNLRLTVSSPLLDLATDAASIAYSAKDFEGNPRVDGVAADLGAYEFVAVTSAPQTLVPRVAMLHPAVPNPFNPSTTISYDVARQGRVALRVFDLRGRLVTTLAEGDHRAGAHVVTWNGVDASGRAVSSGVYFIRMEAQNYGDTRKLVLVK